MTDGLGGTARTLQPWSPSRWNHARTISPRRSRESSGRQPASWGSGIGPRPTSWTQVSLIRWSSTILETLAMGKGAQAGVLVQAGAAEARSSTATDRRSASRHPRHEAATWRSRRPTPTGREGVIDAVRRVLADGGPAASASAWIASPKRGRSSAVKRIVESQFTGDHYMGAVPVLLGTATHGHKIDGRADRTHCGRSINAYAQQARDPRCQEQRNCPLRTRLDRPPYRVGHQRRPSGGRVGKPKDSGHDRAGTRLRARHAAAYGTPGR